MPQVNHYVLGRRIWFAECQTTLIRTLDVKILFGARCVTGREFERPMCGVHVLAKTSGRVMSRNRTWQPSLTLELMPELVLQCPHLQQTFCDVPPYGGVMCITRFNTLAL
jgi:hypothetical protein